MRRALTVLVVTLLLPLAGVPAAEAAASPTPADPPVFTPADGTVVRTTDVDVRVAYAAPVGTINDNHVRFVVEDLTAGTRAFCADPFHVTEGNTVIVCRLRNLTPGHTYRTTVSFTDSTVRTDRASFTVSAPGLTSSSPAALTTVASADAARATYDVPLGATTTARLFSSAKGARTLVPGSLDVTGSTVTVTPTAPLAPGGYALVVDAVAADEATSLTRSTVDFAVGDVPADYPAAPTTYDKGYSGVCCGSDPGLVDLQSPSGASAVAGVTVYDVADPSSQLSTEAAVGSTYCFLGGGLCPSYALPLSGFAGKDVRWFGWARKGDVTTSGPDNPLSVPASAPSAPTGVSITEPSYGSPSYFRVTADVGPEVVGLQVRHDGYPGGTTLVNAVPVDGHVDALMATTFVEDEDVAFTVTAYDAAHLASTPVRLTVAKESVVLAPQAGGIGTVSNSGSVPQVGFNERVRADSVLAMRDPSGALVPGSTSLGGSGRTLLFAPAKPFTTSGTYTYEITAYPKTCTATDPSTCEEKYVGTRPQAVDVTPPPAPTGIAVSPRSLSDGNRTVTVSGSATGSVLVVAVGTAESTVYPGGDSTAAPFSTAFDLAAAPRTLLPVTLTAYDAVSNSVTVQAGSVDNRWDSALTRLTATPLALGNGQTVAVTGHLTRQGTTGTAGHVVEVLQKRDGGTVVSLGRTTTGQGGAFTTTLALTRSGVLYARFTGDATQRPVTGAATPRVAVAAASTPADQPGSISSARLATAVRQGVRLAGTLGSGSDVDLFPFAATSTGRYRLLLSDLPVTARLDLLARDGRVIASSNAPGLGFEEIVGALPPGTYFARVTALGSSSRRSYRLSVTRLPAGVVLLSTGLTSATPYPADAFAEVYNNTAGQVVAFLFVDCVTSAGKVLSRTDWAVGDLRPLGRRAARYSVPLCPTGSSLRVRPHFQSTTSPVLGQLVAQAGTPVRRGGDVAYPVTVRNTGASRSRGGSVQLVLYTADGRVRDYLEAVVPSLAPGGTFRTEHVIPAYDRYTPNRVRALVFV